MSAREVFLVHFSTFISHDVVVGDFCEISNGVKLLGNTAVGNECSIGPNAVVLPGVKIGNNVVVGAGAIVTRNVSDNQTVVGVPAKPISKKQ